MLRFVIRRKMLDLGSGAKTEGLETVDADCPELEQVLRGGGIDPHGAYDTREVAGVELIDDSAERALKAVVSHWREFGPEHGFDECLEMAARTLRA